MVKKKNDDIDNSFELGAFAIKNWWKVIIIIIFLGIALTGFKVQCGKNVIQKDPIRFKVPAGQVQNE